MTDGRNKNPYQGVDWTRKLQVTGCTHMHCINNMQLHEYLRQGLEFATLSNYYPSVPWYPLSSLKENFHRISQSGYVRRGVWHQDRLDINAEIQAWKGTLPAELQTELPFREGAGLFSDLPQELLEAPNAEHHWFSDAGIWLHITAPGCCLSSGSFDVDDRFGLNQHGGIQLGAPVPWRQGFSQLLDSAICPDGGGIVIAHPNWSHLPQDFICELLDSDPRVLGIEVFNHGARNNFSAFSDPIWDAVLSTGRQCFGFFVQDHPQKDQPWKGKIVLLPEERSAESCLRAMRQGRFYGMIADNGLRFEYLDFDGRILRARCNREVVFELISRTGVVGDDSRGTDFQFVLPEEDRSRHVFLRLTAWEGREEEKLYSQPFMLL